MKAAIVAARQVAAALSKDGKTQLGPVLPRLLARHTACPASWQGARPSQQGLCRSHDLRQAPRRQSVRPPPPPFRCTSGPHWPRKSGGSGKQNRNRNAASAPAATRPATARLAHKPADT